MEDLGNLPEKFQVKMTLLVKPKILTIEKCFQQLKSVALLRGTKVVNQKMNIVRSMN